MARGFSLMEAMVAIALSGVLAGTMSASFKGALLEQARARREWEAFTLAQQHLERWTVLPAQSALLQPNSTSTTPGTPADATCQGVAAGERHRRLDAWGNASASGLYDVCVKVSDDSPEAGLKDIRVVVEWAEDAKTVRNIVLRTFR